MPVTLDPDAAAVLKAFREAGRPPYETLSPPEAREWYLKGRVVSHPEPPAIASVQSLSALGPAGAIPMRVYTPLTLRQADGLAPCSATADATTPITGTAVVPIAATDAGNRSSAANHVT